VAFPKIVHRGTFSNDWWHGMFGALMAAFPNIVHCSTSCCMFNGHVAQSHHIHLLSCDVSRI
jgi:hypothetical protein